MEVVFLPNTFHKTEQTKSFRKRTIFNATQSATSATLNTDFHFSELNELTLGNEGSYSINLNPGYMNLILPLVGELITDQKNNIHSIEPGQLLNLNSNISSVIKLRNESKVETSLFLQIIYKNDSYKLTSQVHPVDIEQANQKLHDIPISPEVSLSIGKFLGRFDYAFDIKKNERIIAYVISGVFELEHRLLEAGDVMILSGVDKNQLEMESLAVESILLILKST
ncbi:MAG: hypothetical protein ABI761_01125 [Saprospiraceae bacterium]